MESIFWKDGFNGNAEGGIMFRAFDLVKFVKKVESNDMEVVGIKFDDSNNIELITHKKNKNGEKGEKK